MVGPRSSQARAAAPRPQRRILDGRERDRAKEADGRQLFRLLRARSEQPCRRQATDLQ